MRRQPCGLVRTLEALARPEVSVAGRRWSAFTVWGLLGFAAGTTAATTLAWSEGRSALPVLAAAGLAPVCFVSVARITRARCGEERLVAYHHQLALLGMTGLLLFLVGAPELPTLDAVAVGLGTFFACGRLGCLSVGCCHGRPSAWGMRYRPDHATVGFPRGLVGVPLFPVQAVESVWNLGVAVSAAACVFTGRPPGDALTCYLVLYALGRFVLDPVRGDTLRPRLWGTSEAQWTSAAVAVGVIGAGWAGLVPFHAWQVGAAALLSAVAAVARRSAPPELAAPQMLAKYIAGSR